eukprot:403337277
MDYKYYSTHLDDNRKVVSNQEKIKKQREKHIGQALSELSRKFPISDVLEQKMQNQNQMAQNENQDYSFNQAPQKLMNKTFYLQDSRNNKTFYSSVGSTVASNLQTNKSQIKDNAANMANQQMRTTYNQSFTKMSNLNYSTANGRNASTAIPGQRGAGRFNKNHQQLKLKNSNNNSSFTNYTFLSPQKLSFFKNSAIGFHKNQQYEQNQTFYQQTQENGDHILHDLNEGIFNIDTLPNVMRDISHRQQSDNSGINDRMQIQQSISPSFSTANQARHKLQSQQQQSVNRQQLYSNLNEYMHTNQDKSFSKTKRGTDSEFQKLQRNFPNKTRQNQMDNQDQNLVNGVGGAESYCFTSLSQTSKNLQQQNYNKPKSQSLNSRSFINPNQQQNLSQIRGKYIDQEYLMSVIERQREIQLENLLNLDTIQGGYDLLQNDNLQHEENIDVRTAQVNQSLNAANFIFNENQEDSQLFDLNNKGYGTNQVNSNQLQSKNQSVTQQEYQNLYSNQNKGKRGVIKLKMPQSFSSEQVSSEVAAMNIEIENVSLGQIPYKITVNLNNEHRRSKTQEKGRMKVNHIQMLRKLVKFPKRLDSDQNSKNFSVYQELKHLAPQIIRKNMVDLEYLKRKFEIKDYFLHEQKVVNAPIVKNAQTIKKHAYKRLIQHYQPSKRDSLTIDNNKMQQNHEVGRNYNNIEKLKDKTDQQTIDLQGESGLDTRNVKSAVNSRVHKYLIENKHKLMANPEKYLRYQNYFDPNRLSSDRHNNM